MWLVIHPEAELCTWMRAHGPGAELASSLTAAAGLNACCALEPACVVVSAKLSEKEVRWLIYAIRSQAAIASVPILVLSEGNESSRLGLLKQGADVVLPAPISPAGIVGSVQAMLSLCNRMREGARSSRRGSPRSSVKTPRANIDLHPSGPLSGSIEGSTIDTLLAILAAKQASGRLSIGRTQAARQRLVLHITNGAVLFGRAPGEELSAADAIDAARRWVSGHYEFTPSEAGSEKGARKTVPAPPMTTVEPPTSPRPPTLPAGVAALKPPLGSPAPRAAAPKSARNETLHSQSAVGGDEGLRTRISPIPVEAPKQPWQPPKKATAVEKSASRTMKSVEPEPSTRRPR